MIRYALAAGAAFFIPLILRHFAASPRRSARLPRSSERVLLLGASSGIGKGLVDYYASLLPSPPKVLRVARSPDPGAADFICADLTNAADVLRLRAEVQKRWGGVDTVIVCVGGLTVKPVAELAEWDTEENAKGLKAFEDAAARAIAVNIQAPLLACTALAPLLASSSPAPALFLVSSPAALIPAPTRSLYGATKAASLSFLQSLRIECDAAGMGIAFGAILPGTVDTGLRSRALDGESARSGENIGSVLTTQEVAARTVKAIEHGERMVWLPEWPYRFAHLLYYLFPGPIERGGRKKYGM